MLDRHSHLLNDGEAIAHGIGYPFHYRTGQMASRMFQRQADKRPAGQGIGMGGALPRQEDWPPEIEKGRQRIMSAKHTKVASAKPAVFSSRRGRVVCAANLDCFGVEAIVVGDGIALAWAVGA